MAGLASFDCVPVRRAVNEAIAEMMDVSVAKDVVKSSKTRNRDEIFDCDGVSQSRSLPGRILEPSDHQACLHSPVIDPMDLELDRNSERTPKLNSLLAA